MGNGDVPYYRAACYNLNENTGFLEYIKMQTGKNRFKTLKIPDQMIFLQKQMYGLVKWKSTHIPPKSSRVATP